MSPYIKAAADQGRHVLLTPPFDLLLAEQFSDFSNIVIETLICHSMLIFKNKTSASHSLAYTLGTLSKVVMENLQTLE